MLGHRLRRWPDIDLALGQCLVFTAAPESAEHMADVKSSDAGLIYRRDNFRRLSYDASPLLGWSFQGLYKVGEQEISHKPRLSCGPGCCSGLLAPYHSVLIFDHSSGMKGPIVLSRVPREYTLTDFWHNACREYNEYNTRLCFTCCLYNIDSAS